MAKQERLGALIRQARRTRDITQASLASQVGVWNTTISDYERSAKIPRDDVLYKIAKLLGLDYDYLKVLKATEKPASAA